RLEDKQSEVRDVVPARARIESFQRQRTSRFGDAVRTTKSKARGGGRVCEVSRARAERRRYRKSSSSSRSAARVDELTRRKTETINETTGSCCLCDPVLHVCSLRCGQGGGSVSTSEDC